MSQSADLTRESTLWNNLRNFHFLIIKILATMLQGTWKYIVHSGGKSFKKSQFKSKILRDFFRKMMSCLEK